jgi:DNA-binding CsgD family transcriptional regulator
VYLSPYQAGLLARVMTTLAEPHEERDIRTRVGSLMLDLLGAQHYASYVWSDAMQRFDGGVHLNMDAANLAQYERHYQYHDPITHQLQQHRSAVRVSDVMPQPQLKRTEFFNDFLARDGLYWGVNLYAWHGTHNVGDMRIWRDKRRDNFTRDDLELLDLVRPALVAALHRSAGNSGIGGINSISGSVSNSSTEPLNSAFSAGPQSLLSARERQVAGLAARGLADKAIAHQLGISTTTVRTHLDHAFRKLGAHNRMTLVQKLRR